MPSWLSPQWLCGNSCTWVHDVRLHIPGTSEPKSAQQAKQGTWYKWSYVIHDTQSAQIPQKQDRHNKNEIMKLMCPPGYHHNGFVATHAPVHMMYGYTLLVPMNQRLLNNVSKEHNINGHKWSTT